MTDKSTIPLPDHPLRRHWVYQLFDRTWRTFGFWIGGPINLGYSCIYAPASGQPLEEFYLVANLSIAVTVLGLKTWEKAKAIA